MTKQYAHAMQPGDKITKCKVHEWYDHIEGVPMWGIQIKLVGQAHRFYQHVTKQDGSPMLFKDKIGAEVIMDTIKDLYGE